MPSLTDLIEKIEAAGGPDRDLDKAIQTLVDGFEHADHLSNRPFTASIDAAMTLVPKGWEWAYLDKAAIVRVPGAMTHTMGSGATPALALCAAALKSRQEDPNHGN